MIDANTRPRTGPMPTPPGSFGLVIVGLGALFWVIALAFCGAASIWPDAPGVKLSAVFWVGLVSLITVVFALAYLLYRRNLPTRVLSYCPVQYQDWFELDFVAPAQNPKLHLWLNLDITSEVVRGGQMLLVDIQSARDGVWRPAGYAVFHWHRIQESQKSVRQGRHLISRLMNVTMQTRFQGATGTGSIRCLARVGPISDTQPGQRVTVRGCVHSSDVALHQFQAEAFVAAS